MSNHPSDWQAQVRDEVHALTQSPEVMKHFRVIVKAFVGARWQGQDKAVWLEKREQHFAQVAKNPILQNKEKPPHEGWVYDSIEDPAQQPLGGWVSPKQNTRIGTDRNLLKKYLRKIQRSKRLTSYERDQTREKNPIPPGKGYEWRTCLPHREIWGWCPQKLSRASAPPAPPNLFAFERRRVSLEEKYLVLAAAHDAAFADKNQHIDPWEHETKPVGKKKAVGFYGEHEQYRLWVEVSQRKLEGHKDDVRGYLEKVRGDLEEQGLLPSGVNEGAATNVPALDSHEDIDGAGKVPLPPRVEALPSDNQETAKTLRDPISVPWLRTIVTQANCGGDSTKLTAFLKRRNVPLVKIAGKWHAEREHVLQVFATKRSIIEKVQAYGRPDGQDEA